MRHFMLLTLPLALAVPPAAPAQEKKSARVTSDEHVLRNRKRHVSERDS